MNLHGIDKLKGVLEMLLDYERRVNINKPVKYWYPLSLATYGVEEILEALDSMCSFLTSMSLKTQAFERNFAQFQGSRDAIFVNSGSSADLLLTLLLTNPMKRLLEPGDEVLVPTVTWPTQIWSVMMAGLKPRFVDTDPATLNMNLDHFESQISERTKAAFIVHVMGNPCNMDRVCSLAERHGLILIEDCCEAMGSSWNGRRVGNFGLGGAFSSFFSHHMMTMEGGLVCCNSEENADYLKILRAHGWIRNVDQSKFPTHKWEGIDPRYAFVNWGLNVRPTEVQSAFGLHQLTRLPAFNERRIEVGNRIFKHFDRYSAWLSRPQVDNAAKPVWFAIPLLVKPEAPFSVHELTAYLEQSGIETRPIITGNILRHPVAAHFEEFRTGEFKGSDYVHDQGFYVGLTPIQPDAIIDRLLETFDRFFSKYSGTRIVECDVSLEEVLAADSASRDNQPATCSAEPVPVKESR